MKEGIFLLHEGEQSGPFTEPELRNLASSGRLSETDMVWWEGMSDWVKLGDSASVANLHSHLTIPPPRMDATNIDAPVDIAPVKIMAEGSGDLLHFRCSYCERVSSADRSAAGTTVRCSKCKRPVVVPQESIKPITSDFSVSKAKTWILGAVIGWIGASVVVTAVFCLFEPSLEVREFMVFPATGVFLAFTKLAIARIESRRTKRNPNSEGSG